MHLHNIVLTIMLSTTLHTTLGTVLTLKRPGNHDLIHIISLPNISAYYYDFTIGPIYQHSLLVLECVSTQAIQYVKQLLSRQ